VLPSISPPLFDCADVGVSNKFLHATAMYEVGVSKKQVVGSFRNDIDFGSVS
jgi:hypothetical protein